MSRRRRFFHVLHGKTRLDAFFTLVEYGRTISREIYKVSRATVQPNSNYARLTELARAGGIMLSRTVLVTGFTIMQCAVK